MERAQHFHTGLCDFGPFNSTDSPCSQQQVAAQIADASSPVGVFYLANCGYDSDHVEPAFQASSKDFLLPLSLTRSNSLWPGKTPQRQSSIFAAPDAPWTRAKPEDLKGSLQRRIRRIATTNAARNLWACPQQRRISASTRDFSGRLHQLPDPILEALRVRNLTNRQFLSTRMTCRPPHAAGCCTKPTLAQDFCRTAPMGTVAPGAHTDYGKASPCLSRTTAGV